MASLGLSISVFGHVIPLALDRLLFLSWQSLWSLSREYAVPELGPDLMVYLMQARELEGTAGCQGIFPRELECSSETRPQGTRGCRPGAHLRWPSLGVGEVSLTPGIAVGGSWAFRRVPSRGGGVRVGPWPGQGEGNWQEELRSLEVGQGQPGGALEWAGGRRTRAPCVQEQRGMC